MAARPSVARLFAMVPEADAIVELEWRGGPLRVAAMRRDAARLRAEVADAAVLLPNSFASALLASRARVPERWGYAGDLRTSLLTRAIDRPPAGLHQARYYQHLLEALGVPAGPLEPRIVLADRTREESSALLRAGGWEPGRPLIALAPGAAYGTAKQWPPEHFATLVERLVTGEHAFCAILGTAADAGVAQAIRERLPARTRGGVADLCGRTTLETLAGILATARACVSNDSGAMHLAAAAGVPLAALFGPTNERETAPLPRRGVAAEILIHQVSCRPCMLRECPIDHPCMRDLEPDRVLRVVRELIAR
jgi:heptosyltransferase-2